MEKMIKKQKKLEMQITKVKIEIPGSQLSNQKKKVF